MSSSSSTGMSAQLSNAVHGCGLERENDPAAAAVRRLDRARRVAS
jgi:hypothetical protein